MTLNPWRLRWRVLPTEHWTSERARLRAENKGRAPDHESVNAMLVRLDSMLTVATENFDRLDRKAAGILGAIAAVAAFLAGNLNIVDLPTRVLGGVTLVLALGGAICAVTVIRSTAYSAGAGAIEIAKGTAEDPLKRDQGIIESLAVAIVQAEQVMEVKANWLNAGLIFGVCGILMLALFAAAGGVE